MTVRLAADYGTARTRLVDAHPATATYADAPLQPGETFVDPLSGVQVTVESVALGIATVGVIVPGTTTVQPAPPPAVQPPAGSSSVGVATITVTRPQRRQVVVRVTMPVATGATRCATRVGRTAWTSCRLRGGRLALVRTAGARPSVAISVRIDGRPALSAVVRLPQIGGAVRIARSIP